MKDAPGLHYLCKVEEEGLIVWKILCVQCRNSFPGFKCLSLSEFDCEKCGQPCPITKEKKS
jgi:hypothetical protein